MQGMFYGIGAAVIGIIARSAFKLTLAFEGEFDAALCFGNSFGYLSRADTKHFLKRLLGWAARRGEIRSGEWCGRRVHFAEPRPKPLDASGGDFVP